MAVYKDVTEMLHVIRGKAKKSVPEKVEEIKPTKKQEVEQHEEAKETTKKKGK